jgi:hypothetical protein
VTQEKINALMLAANAKAKLEGTILVQCPLGDCDWSKLKTEGTAKNLRRHLIASH